MPESSFHNVVSFFAPPLTTERTIKYYSSSTASRDGLSHRPAFCTISPRNSRSHRMLAGLPVSGESIRDRVRPRSSHPNETSSRTNRENKVTTRPPPAPPSPVAIARLAPAHGTGSTRAARRRLRASASRRAVVSRPGPVCRCSGDRSTTVALHWETFGPAVPVRHA